jgi:CotH kinase protein/Lamin Tail Domain
MKRTPNTTLAGKAWLLFLLFALLPVAGRARVVINEVFYHAPNDIEDLEYIELHNSGVEAVDLSGWAFTKGIQFKFPAGARIEAKGFLVLCRNRERFREFYEAPVAGVFNQPLSNKKERIQLSDASGKAVDTVKYKDSPPWPMGADGLSGSLERISPDASGDDASNWASSPLSENRSKPGGTPGKVNVNFSAQLPPVISNVKFAPENPAPDQAIAVEAEVRDPGGVKEVTLRFRLAGPGFEKPETSVPMKAISETHFAATIPGQAADQLIRFRIQAMGASGARRFFPAETEPRPALSSYVHGPIEPAKIPFGWIINTTESEFKAAQQRGSGPGFGGFDPRMFDRFDGGERGGPPGPGGFGPGGFDAEEQARTKARSTLESGLDFASAWFDLSVSASADFAALQKLKPVFIAKVSERDKMIDNILEAPKIDEKLKTIPELIERFRAGLAESLKPFLSEEQSRIFAEWIEKEKEPAGAPGMILSRVNLEAAWSAVSIKSDLEEARFVELRNRFRALLKQRDELVREVTSGKGQDDGFRELRERADALGQNIVGSLQPSLSPIQEKQLEEWQRGPVPTIVAFRGGPGGFGGGPRGFGGPDGFFGGFGGPPSEIASSRSAFVYYEPVKQRLELYDFVQVPPRKGGQKVHFQKDKPLDGMTTVNLIFEGETATLAEPLAYEVYRKVGMAAEQSYHLRLWLNGKPLGYYLLVEQPNRAFLRRNNVRDDGNMYKILWYENGVVGQHEKKTHVQEGHDDIVALIDALEKTSGDAQWEVIEKNFDVAQVVNYFAVNTVLSHWDGFFNNYFAYHDRDGTGKWTMYPWDQDQTWGVVNMMGGGQVFYNMPITFGMNGDLPPGIRREAARPGTVPRQSSPREGFRGGPGFSFGFGFGGGGAGWWRQPGYFSGPLLANPQFRKQFLTRTKEILETIYTEDVFVPIINAMGERLQPEVKLRAELMRNDPERATNNLEQNLQNLRDHVKMRREFLLAQDEINNARPFSKIAPPASPAKN